MRLFKNAKYDFLNQRRRAYVFSASLIVAGLVSIAGHGGLRAGVEFTGGTLIQVHLQKDGDVGALREALGSVGLATAQIQRFAGTNEFLLRVQALGSPEEAGVGSSSEVVEQALKERFGEGGFEVTRVEAVGPKVGGELQVKATYAILLSFLLTLIYLAFRFEWRFGVAAVVATVHDIVITFGFISLFNIEITLATVAAILTIVGYSLNDTIVIFDRIRENMRKKRKEPYVDALNRSINETLPRTVLTSGTTLVALVSLFVLGGAVIRPFALVLILGIAIGTYSSIFVASPALLEIDTYGQKRTKRARATG
ncbi:MAG: protein translocase subunit SecF [Gemmatimonadota bacterium]